MRKIPGIISSSGVISCDDENNSLLGSGTTSSHCGTLFRMSAWLKLCKIVNVDTTNATIMKKSVADLMPYTIQSILASDTLRVSRVMTVVHHAVLTQTGLWVLTLMDCTGAHIEAFVDPDTASRHAGLNQCGTALLIENAALFLERSTLERYLNLHHSCIVAVFPQECDGVDEDISSCLEEYTGI